MQFCLSVKAILCVCMSLRVFIVSILSSYEKRPSLSRAEDSTCIEFQSKVMFSICAVKFKKIIIINETVCFFYNPEDEDGNLSFRQFQINVTSCSIYNTEYLVLCSFLADSANCKYHNLNDTILNNGGTMRLLKETTRYICILMEIL